MNRYQSRIDELSGQIFRASEGKLPVHLSEQQLNNIEAAIGASLPDNYREFLRDFGGYKIHARFIYAPLTHETGGIGSISIFHGFMPSRPLNDLLSVHSQFDGWKPAELLCIASSRGPDQICLALEGGKSGAIYYWDHIADNVADDYTTVHLVANTFDEFMKLLIDTSDE